MSLIPFLAASVSRRHGAMRSNLDADLIGVTCHSLTLITANYCLLLLAKSCAADIHT